MTDITINIKTGSENSEPEVTTNTGNTKTAVPKVESPKMESTKAEAKEETIAEKESPKEDDSKKMGMTEEEHGHSKTLIYQYLPSRYGMNPDDLRRCDAIEVVVGQGAKPGGGGMLLGQKISDRVANMRNLPKGIDQRSACRHPDWTGPDDLEIKILELREITDWE